MQLKNRSKSRLLDERVKYTTDLACLSTSNPTCALTLTIVMFSLAGIPPLAGFYSKAFLLFSAIRGAHYVIAMIGILMSVISAFYYIRIVKIMYFEPIISFKSSIRHDNSLPSSSSPQIEGISSTNTSLAKTKFLHAPLFKDTTVSLRSATSMISFTQMNKEISLVCSLAVAFLLFFCVHPKALFLLTNKSALLLTLIEG